ncbi:MAG: PEP-CTERM sorting domain-containing protein [Fimbriimonadales bacterium]|nr:PEP-CTERM sorting domain-containing protein [Fimbriimonadales bacterium]
MLSKVRIVCSLAALGAVASSQAVVLVDRGLPNQNLNNAAGSNRSNVAWGSSASGSFTGDDFTLPNAAPAYAITGIRTWLVTLDDYAASPQASFGSLIASLTLWLGPAGGTGDVAATPYAFTATRVTYDGTTTYQGGSGALRSLWQIDWDTTGLVLPGGAKMNFGVSGSTTSGSTLIFNHASNAAKGGVPADGADGSIKGFQPDGSFDYIWNSGVDGGWDKPSDINVVVTGVPVPEPATLALGLGGLAAAALRRRRR